MSNISGEKGRCLTSTAIKAMQTKPPYTHYNAIIFNAKQYSQKDVEKPKFSYIASGEIECYNHIVKLLNS